MTPEERDAYEAEPYFAMRDQRDSLIEVCDSLVERIRKFEEYVSLWESVPVPALNRVFSSWKEALDRETRKYAEGVPDDVR